MKLKIKRYLSAYNEYCGVNVKAVNSTTKFIVGNRDIGNRESGTGNWFLVPYFIKCLEYFKTVKWETGNRGPGSSSLFLTLVYHTNVSKVRIGNKEPVPGSLLTIIGFILVSGFVYFINV